MAQEAQEQQQTEGKEFEGNYMEKFKDGSQNKHYPGAMLRWERRGEVFDFFTNETTLRLTVISDFIVRFRYANYGRFQDDFSYAIVDGLTPNYRFLEANEHDGHIELLTAYLSVLIDKATLAVKIKNKNGLVVMEDEAGFHWEDHRSKGGNIVINTKKIQSGENFYGLGDKPTDHNLRGLRLQLWGSDTYGFGKDTDPIYKNIPFFMGLHHKVGYGLFFDNSFRTTFDFGHERQNVFSFWSQGGEMNYYFIYGPSLLDVAERYTDLTGKPELPPKWVLGYQQSKWSYYPEKEVKELAATFRQHKIPCDVIHLDIDYMDGFRCFTWNKEHFPDPARMISELAEDGFKAVAIIDPGIKIDPGYWVYAEGLEANYFCKRQDGDLFRGSVWPGPCNFPDFTHPGVRNWWSDLFPPFMASGLAGVWNDMNEPAVFEEGTFPEDVRHDYDGNPCSHRKAHNVYGMQMARATYEGLKRSNPDKRPFTLTRSCYAGSQRHAAVWTGDNVASWEHLIIANVMCQRLSMSGISFAGTDVGGFIESPSSELYIRWLQMAVFHPFFRTHSSGDHGDQEPWSFGEEPLPIIRRIIEFRYRLLPYMYTTFWQYVNRGTPMIRPLFLVEQSDPETYYRNEEFMFGDNLMVVPISQPHVEGRWLYMPQGVWYYLWNGKRYVGAGEEIWIDASLEFLPVFVKAGAVVPFGTPQQYVGEIEPTNLAMHVYYIDGEKSSEFYDDAGDGYGYKNGEFTRRTFAVEGDMNYLNIEQRIEGDYNPSYTSYSLKIHGVPFEVQEIEVDGEVVFFEHERNRNRLVVDVPARFSKVTVRI